MGSTCYRTGSKPLRTITPFRQTGGPENLPSIEQNDFSIRENGFYRGQNTGLPVKNFKIKAKPWLPPATGGNGAG